ncbi:MAG: NAD(P)-dependent oxidoreductase [Proteobacteria bacterium]|nr:NAD(P)-dependent oxidoreductase [Pseudomonadota bacterium]
MRVVITGASGFIGKHLISKLRESQEANLEIVGVSRRKIDGLLQVSDYKNTPRGDVLIHLAEENSRSGALNSGDDGIKNASETIESLTKKQFSKIVYASSAVVYGDSSTNKHSITDELIPADMYAKLKVAGEQTILASNKSFVLRISNLYGDGMSLNNVTNTIIQQAKIDNKIEVESLIPIRDFLWIEDAIQAIIKIIFDNSKKYQDQVFNIGSGVGTSIQKLAETALQIAGRSDFKIHARSTRAPSCLILNIEETIRQLDWQPKVNVYDGFYRLMHPEK